MSPSTNNKYQLHPKKYNELHMTFSRSPADRELVQINNCKVNTTNITKLLGLYSE